MLFRKTSRVDVTATALVECLKKHLAAGERVLWLVSGGSAIDVAVAAAKQLKGTDTSKLTVTLADERFGPVGHIDSNWFKLERADFAVPGARIVPVLNGSDLLTTSRQFGNMLDRELRDNDYTVALLGIGPDGHTAGILPGTEAVDAPGMAVGYITDQYKRLTMTGNAIAALDEAIVFAMGEAKKEALENLTKDMPAAVQPAQYLKAVPLVTIYNDQVGEEAV